MRTHWKHGEECSWVYGIWQSLSTWRTRWTKRITVVKMYLWMESQTVLGITIYFTQKFQDKCCHEGVVWSKIQIAAIRTGRKLFRSLPCLMRELSLMVSPYPCVHTLSRDTDLWPIGIWSVVTRRMIFLESQTSCPYFVFFYFSAPNTPNFVLFFRAGNCMSSQWPVSDKFSQIFSLSSSTASDPITGTMT